MRPTICHLNGRAERQDAGAGVRFIYSAQGQHNTEAYF